MDKKPCLNSVCREYENSPSFKNHCRYFMHDSIAKCEYYMPELPRIPAPMGGKKQCDCHGELPEGGFEDALKRVTLQCSHCEDGARWCDFCIEREYCGFGIENNLKLAERIFKALKSRMSAGHDFNKEKK